MSIQKVIPMIKKSLAKSLTMVLTLALLLSIVAPAMAQKNRVAAGRNVSTAPSQAQGPSDPAEMEAFLDELFGKEMEEYHIAGAAVAVVKDGKLFWLMSNSSAKHTTCRLPHHQQTPRISTVLGMSLESSRRLFFVISCVDMRFSFY